MHAKVELTAVLAFSDNKPLKRLSPWERYREFVEEVFDLRVVFFYGCVLKHGPSHFVEVCWTKRHPVQHVDMGLIDVGPHPDGFGRSFGKPLGYPREYVEVTSAVTDDEQLARVRALGRSERCATPVRDQRHASAPFASPCGSTVNLPYLEIRRGRSVAVEGSTGLWVIDGRV